MAAATVRGRWSFCFTCQIEIGKAGADGNETLEVNRTVAEVGCRYSRRWGSGVCKIVAIKGVKTAAM